MAYHNIDGYAVRRTGPDHVAPRSERAIRSAGLSTKKDMALMPGAVTIARLASNVPPNVAKSRMVAQQ